MVQFFWSIVTEQEAEKIAGKEIVKIIKEKSIMLYEKAAEYALKKGIIIADTKFEFGVVDGKIILIDEVFTPDSSRFWNKEKYQPASRKKTLTNSLFVIILKK